MRSVQITRKKSFFGALIPYFVFIGYPKAEIAPSELDDVWDYPEESSISINNGQTISFAIKDTECNLVIWADTSTGMASGPAYHINAGTRDIQLELITQYSWKTGSRYILKEIM